MEAEKFLKLDEFARLVKVAKDDREKCILLLLAGAGLRVGETVAIMAEDIDFGKAYLHIRSANAKLKKASTVVLLPPVINALQKYLVGGSEGWLFPGYGGKHISARQVQKILDHIAERSGLQKVEHQDRIGPGRYRIHPHLLRHSFAMWSLDNGVPIYDLQKQLGHAIRPFLRVCISIYGLLPRAINPMIRNQTNSNIIEPLLKTRFKVKILLFVKRPDLNYVHVSS